MSTVRTQLVPAALAWLGEHFLHGTSQPVAWEDATRVALNLPLTDDDETPLMTADFSPADYGRAQRAFGEIVTIARQVGDDNSTNDDELTCRGAYLSLQPTTAVQVDLSPAQLQSVALHMIVDAIRFYITYIPGGLQHATRDLEALMSGETLELRPETGGPA